MSEKLDPLKCNYCGFVLTSSQKPIADGDLCPWCDRGYLKPTKVESPDQVNNDD